jgi:hypothetical protein
MEKSKFKISRVQVSVILIYVFLALSILIPNAGKITHTLKMTANALFVMSVGLFLLYSYFCSLRTGSIKYRIVFCTTHERNSSPFLYWFYTIAAGVIGVGLIIAAPILLLRTL